MGCSHYVTAYTTQLFTCHLQKYKTKTRRVHRRLVFSLIIASLIFVIITILYFLTLSVVRRTIVRRTPNNRSSDAARSFVERQIIGPHLIALTAPPLIPQGPTLNPSPIQGRERYASRGPCLHQWFSRVISPSPGWGRGRGGAIRGH